MVDIKIYAEHQDNLCSVKGVNDDYSGRIYLRNLFHNLSNHASCLIVLLRRPNYDVEKITDKIKENAIELDLYNLMIHNEFFEVSFSLDIHKKKEEQFWTLVTLWFAFEQPLLVFYVNRIELENDQKRILNEKLSWNEISDQSKVYVLFKSAEEDVVWMGKNPEMKFESVLAL